jgi:hypothetical protein
MAAIFSGATIGEAHVVRLGSWMYHIYCILFNIHIDGKDSAVYSAHNFSLILACH